MINAGREGGVVLKCHAGCETTDVLRAMGKTFADLSPRPKPKRLVKEYIYTDAHNKELWRVRRYEPKDFRCFPGLPAESERVLFQLPWVKYAKDSGAPVYLVEGEKDVESILDLQLGIPATCNVGGAGKWLPQYTRQLTGCHVRIVADNDEPGRAHARRVAKELEGRAASVQVLTAAAGKDVTDHLAAGYSLDELEPLGSQEQGLHGSLVSELTIRKVEWLWKPYLPMGTLVIVEGDPGDGKSTMVADIAARISSGMRMPDGKPSGLDGPASCIVLSAEDDPEATIAPRLIAAGCDPKRIKIITGGRDPEGLFDITTDLELLEAEIQAMGARFVVIDPVTAYLGEGTDTNSDHSVRRALAPLVAMARRHGCTILLVRHLNKSTSGKAIHRGGGSVGFVGIVRAAHLVYQHPDDDTLRVLAPIKSNLGSKGSPLVFHLLQDKIYEVARVEWDGPLDTSAQELLDGPAQDRDSRRDVEEFLSHICADEPLRWADIVAAGKDAGFSASSMEAHRSKVLVKLFQPGEGNRGVTWRTKSRAGGPSKPRQVVDVPLPEEPSESREDQLDRQLQDKPPLCEICGSGGVMRFGRPHWVVRCKAHNPLTFRTESAS